MLLQNWHFSHSSTDWCQKCDYLHAFRVDFKPRITNVHHATMVMNIFFCNLNWNILKLNKKCHVRHETKQSEYKKKNQPLGMSFIIHSITHYFVCICIYFSNTNFILIFQKLFDVTLTVGCKLFCSQCRKIDYTILLSQKKNLVHFFS